MVTFHWLYILCISAKLSLNLHELTRRHNYAVEKSNGVDWHKKATVWKVLPKKWGFTFIRHWIKKIKHYIIVKTDFACKQRKHKSCPSYFMVTSACEAGLLLLWVYRQTANRIFHCFIFVVFSAAVENFATTSGNIPQPSPVLRHFFKNLLKISCVVLVFQTFTESITLYFVWFSVNEIALPFDTCLCFVFSYSTLLTFMYSYDFFLACSFNLYFSFFLYFLSFKHIPRLVWNP